MKILFIGTPDFAVPSLEILKDKLAAVITHPDRPKGRHLKINPPPVKLAAQKYNLPVYQPERISSPEFIEELRKMAPDLIVIVSFGEILKKEVLKTARLGCINLHASLLPKYRGAAPIAGALMNGDAVTGITTFWLSEKMDSGDIIMQKEVPIYPSDNKGILEQRLAAEGSRLLAETINYNLDKRVSQNESKATYAHKVKKEDGLIDWRENAVSINNKIRAMNPWPAAYTFFGGVRVEIWEGEAAVEGDYRTEAGTVAVLGKDGIGVSTGKGLLLIKELQAEGRKRLKAADFIHGYRINEGFRFGA